MAQRTRTAEGSWQHRLAVRALRLTNARGPFTGQRVHATVEKLRAKPQATTAPAQLTRGLSVTTSEHEGWPVWTLALPASSSDRVVVALHGGAYVGDLSSWHWKSYARLARTTGASVVVPGYPLAPTGTAPVVVPQMADLISDQVAKYGPANVGVIGDSAGAGLALAALQVLVQRRSATPARLVLFSPWLDATVSDPRSLMVDDPMLDVSGLRACGRLWAGTLPPEDAMVSPLFGPLAGLPPTAVYSGSLDLLYPDALNLQARAEQEGADFTFVLREGLMHSWPGIVYLPEARAIESDVARQLIG